MTFQAVPKLVSQSASHVAFLIRSRVCA